MQPLTALMIALAWGALMGVSLVLLMRISLPGKLPQVIALLALGPMYAALFLFRHWLYHEYKWEFVENTQWKYGPIICATIAAVLTFLATLRMGGHQEPSE